MTKEQIAHRDEVVRKLLKAVELLKDFSPNQIENAFKSILGAEYYGVRTKIALARERIAGDPSFEDMQKQGLVEGQ